MAIWRIAAGLIWFALAICAQATRANDTASFEPVRQHILERIRSGSSPSVAVAVARNGVILWEEGFGFEDPARTRPATAHSLYNIASITKPITATAVLKLVEGGAVSLDAPIDRYLGETKLTHFPGDPVGPTVRQVLMHRSGLPDHWEVWDMDQLATRPPFDETIRRYGFGAWPAGTHYQYSNLGYGVLGDVIHRVSGRSYADYLRSVVFQPLKMRDARVGAPEHAFPGLAEPFDRSGRPIPMSESDTIASGSVFDSVHDLALFGNYHLGYPKTGRATILTDADVRLMHESAQTTTGSEKYGLGWTVNDDILGYRFVFHGGASPGYDTSLALIPSEGLVIAVMTNSNGSDVTQAVTREILMQLLPPFRARVEALSQAAGHPSSAPASAPLAPTTPQPLVGRWTGTVRTYTGDVPLTVWCDPNGTARMQIGSALPVLIDEPDFRGGDGLGGLAVGDIGTADAARYTYDLQLDLVRDGDRLYGVLGTVQKRGDRLRRRYAELGHFVSLKRN